MGAVDLLTREECRQADENAIRNFCIPSLVLMENAGRNCAELIVSHSRQEESNEQAVVVLCGPGNNGGDGFVIARHLYNSGLKVKVILFRRAEAYSGDAMLNLIALSRLRMPVVENETAWPHDKSIEMIAKVGRRESTWVVDALLGTGATGEPRESIAGVIKIANALPVRRFAVDIPTGLDCDTGRPSKATFRADLTGTFIDQKVGFENAEAQAFLGQVVVCGIGAPREIFR